MVIMQHAPIPAPDNNPVIVSACSFLNYAAVGLFFMVSGALLLPVRHNTSPSFFKHRFSKIMIPTLIWSVIYIIFEAIHTGHSPWSCMIRSLCLLPFGPQGTPAFWFIYVLAGLYLFAPIISPWIEKATEKEIRCFLAIWAITLTIPIIQPYVAVPYGYYSVYCYFGGYLGYFILGYYLNRFIEKPIIFLSLVLIFVPVFVYAICKLAGMRSDFHTYYYLSVFSATMSVGWFIFFKSILTNRTNSRKWEKWRVSLSNSCFGIYLVHVFIMRELLWNLPFISGHGLIFQITSTTLLTFILSYALTYAISKLPFSKHLIGY